MSDVAWNVEKYAADVRSVARSAFEAGGSAVFDEAVATIASFAESVCSGRPMACAPGCPHCCVLNVAVLLPEAMLIAEWLRARLTPTGLETLKERLGAHRSSARWMEDEERIIRQVFCPFLDGYGSCSIHPIRPLACRGAASLDGDACREAFAPVATDEPRTVPADLLRQAVYDDAFSALGEELGHCGLDNRSIELGAGVVAFLENPGYRDMLKRGERLPQSLWA